MITPEEKFMRLAIKEAKKSKEPIGSGTVIVKGDKVISKAYSKQRLSCNATAHAEILAIQKAGKKLHSKNLEGCIMYSTTEPCIMCLAAASFAKIAGIVFGTTMEETYGKHMIDLINIENFIGHSYHKFEYLGGFLHEECEVLLKDKN